MSAAALVAELRSAGVVLAVEGERLRVNAPRGVLTPEQRAAIATEKDAVMALLMAEADALALDSLDAVLGDDGAEPEPLPATDPALAETVANARALDSADWAAWRVLVPPGTCLRGDAPCPTDGRHWCVKCSITEAKAMEVNP